MVMSVTNRSKYLSEIVESSFFFNELDVSDKFDFKIKKTVMQNSAAIYLLESGHIVTQSTAKDVIKSNTKLVESNIADFGFLGSLALPNYIWLTLSGELVIISQGKKIYEKKVAKGNVRFLKKNLCVYYSDSHITFFHIDAFHLRREESYELD